MADNFVKHNSITEMIQPNKIIITLVVIIIRFIACQHIIAGW